MAADSLSHQLFQAKLVLIPYHQPTPSNALLYLNVLLDRVFILWITDMVFRL